MGWRIRRAGDLNGDGYADIVLGVPHWNGAHHDCGQARVYFGGPHGPSTRPDWTFEGSNLQTELGQDVTGVGDMDGDGWPEIAVGEPLYSSRAFSSCGRVLVFRCGPHGPTTRPAWTMEGFGLSSRFGRNVCDAGDVDGDGLHDLAVGAPSYSASREQVAVGMVAVLLGRLRGAPRAVDWYAVGGSAGALLGESVAAIGDVNGDGRADLLVGAPGHADRSSVRGLALLYMSRPGK